LARLLLNDGYEVEVYVVNFSDKRSDDFLLNLSRLKEQKLWPEFLDENTDLPELPASDIIIDAIFGIGLNRPAEAWVKEIIKHLNASKAYKIAVDVPSGLYLDKAPDDKEAIVKANTTISFQLPKLVFFLPETADFTGNVEIVDLGLDEEFITKVAPEALLISRKEAQHLYKPRQKFSHKGTFGHNLVVGGSYGKIGSVVLATKASLRIGAGKVTALIPNCGYQILQSTVPEAMVITSENDNHLVSTDIDLKIESICFGIGAGENKETAEFLKQILKEVKVPLLIDADGLNLLSKNPDFYTLLPKKSILTPHPGELKRLLGDWEDDFDKLEKAKAFSKKHQLILVIKGAYTLIIADENIYVNTTGNPGMATAGSGDVLSGVVSGLLSQGYDPLIATVFGVYLHGKAGDFAAQKLGFEAVIADDVIENLGNAYKSLFQQKKN
jgi:hydroxyethylthiazole kinase-like uncharacterized protein yjeF